MIWESKWIEEICSFFHLFKSLWRHSFKNAMYCLCGLIWSVYTFETRCDDSSSHFCSISLLFFYLFTLELNLVKIDGIYIIFWPVFPFLHLTYIMTVFCVPVWFNELIESLNDRLSNMLLNAECCFSSMQLLSGLNDCFMIVIGLS